MSVQYLSDEKGRITAVQVSIEDWEIIKSRYPGIEHVDSILPEWHRELIDCRLAAIAGNPALIKGNLIEELDK